MPQQQPPPSTTRTGRSARDDVRIADVLGVPVAPPGMITTLGNRSRAGLARVWRSTAPPPARLLEAALGSLDLAAVVALCRLDVPDRLTEPTKMASLTADLGVDRARFERLIRYASTRGFLRLDRRGRVRPTSVTRFLRRDHPGGWHAWVEFASGPEIARAMLSLDAGLSAGGDAFADANGAPFFAWMSAHPDRHAVFDAAMAAGARMHGLLLARAVDWAGSRHVCDVGGGDGSLLGVLLAQHQHLEGVLLDLPEVVARAPDRARLERVGGDAFESVPAGCDTYLLVNVLHDWDDRDARRLLERTAAAAGTTAAGRDGHRIIVVESEAHARPRDDLAIRADLLMLALTPGGRERTTEEIAALAEPAGLVLSGRHTLASGDVAHVLRARS